MGDRSYHHATRRGFDAFDRGDMESSLAAFEDAYRIARNDPERAAAELQIAYRLQSLGRDEPSTKAATKALARFRGVADAAATPDEVFMAKMNVGYCLGVLAEFETALALFREMLSLSGSPTQSADIHNQIGNQLCGLDRHEEALEHFRQAAEMEGAEAEVRTPACLHMGKTAQDRGDSAAKLKWFRRALDLGALSRMEEAECWWAVAGAHYVLGEHRQAKDALDRMLANPEVNPDFVRDAKPMFEELSRRFTDSAPDPAPAPVTDPPPPEGSDARDVICGMDGDIHWRPVLPPSGLDGLETEGVWERDGDSLLVRSKDGTASLAFGEESWEDCELDVHVTPLEGGNAQAVVRSSFMGAYVVDLMLGWQVVQIARTRSYGLDRLSVVDFPLMHGREYHLRVAARGGSITSYVDGKLVNQATDFEMRRGKLGLLAWHSVTRYRAPRYRLL